MASLVNNILADLKSKNMFGVITRRNYSQTITTEELMEEIETVGKYRNPEFVIDDNNRFAYMNLAKWIIGDPTITCLNPETRRVEKGSLTKGIFLAGGTGTGKSLAMEIISYLAKLHKFQFEVFGQAEPLLITNVRVEKAVDKFSSNEESLKNRVLCFNDLGTETKEAVYMGNRQDVMRQYIETRADNQSYITCFTSNYPMMHQFIEERYGDRAVSRLRQMCNYLEMRGEDRRR